MDEMEILFNLFKVRYVLLDELIVNNSTVRLDPYSTVNVFINLECVVNRIATPRINEYLRIQNNTRSTEFISNVINLAAHYRLFFTKNKIRSNIYLYLPYPFRTVRMKNKMLNASYRDNYEFRYKKNPNNYILSEIIEKSIPLIKLILEYVQGVYFIQSGNIENSVIPYVICKNTKRVDANYIVSTSQYDLQCVTRGFDIIIPHKDESEIITSDNAIEKIKENSDIYSNQDISPDYISFILSIIGDRTRNIERIKGFGVKKVFKYLDDALKAGLITPHTNNINLLSNVLSDKFRSKVLTNFYCTDINVQYSVLNQSDIYEVMKQIVDKFDNPSLKKMNDTYFNEFPIQLVELTSCVREKQNISF